MSEQITAWDLAGDWSWMASNTCKVASGRVEYDEAFTTAGRKTVTLKRLVGSKTTDERPREIRRYVAWDTPMIIVPVL